MITITDGTISGVSARQTEVFPPRTTGVRTGREWVLTETQRGGEPVSAAWRRLGAALAEREAEVLGVMIYASIAAQAEVEQAMNAALGGTDWPVTWIDGAGGDEAALMGVQVFAVSGYPVERLRLGQRVVGSVFEDGEARHCLLGGLGPTSIALERAAQVQQMFANLEWVLGRAGFALRDVVRTWFYNDDILAWYDEFNRVRTAHYATVAWRTGSLPASTGIGAKNPAGAALVVAAWAMQPLAPSSFARAVGSPLQCPAPAYGSAFSRAVELRSGGVRRLFISGTASIHPDGKTAWVGDPEKQVALTMEVVGAILQSRGLHFGHVTRATAYFRDPRYKAAFAAWRRARALADLPVVELHAVICRDALLFEIEVDAGSAAART
jgi:enamine deaminase RidA (YjgF/YER057c/UK114 family)